MNPAEAVGDDRRWLQAQDHALLEVHGPTTLVAELAALWSRFEAGPPAAPAAVRVRAADRATAAAEINRTLVDHLPHPAVHAGVVALSSGAVAFPVVSGAGKSTLTAALCLAGAAYLSDEALVLDDTGGSPLVVPYPKPLALSPWSAAAVGLEPADALSGDLTPEGDRELLYAPSALGTTGEAVPLAHLLLLERTDGPPRLEDVHRREGLAALLRLSFNHYRDPRRFLVVAAAAVQGAQVHRLLVGDPRDAAALVLDRLG